MIQTKTVNLKISNGQHCKGITKRNNLTKYQVVTTIRGLVSYKTDKMTCTLIRPTNTVRLAATQYNVPMCLNYVYHI